MAFRDFIHARAEKMGQRTGRFHNGGRSGRNTFTEERTNLEMHLSTITNCTGFMNVGDVPAKVQGKIREKIGISGRLELTYLAHPLKR